MSESQSPKPLPRFQPRAAPAPAGSTSQRMSSSLSVDAGLNRFQSKKLPPAPAPRGPKPRQVQFIEFSDRPRPLQTQVTGIFTPPAPRKHEESHDEIESETIAAIKLPLVSQQSGPPPPRELLTPDAKDKLMLVQLPSSLPIVYPNDASQLDYNPLFSVADGHLGTIRIHRSGKVTAKIGNIVFDVESGVPPSCSQMICIKKDSGLEYAPIQGGKLKFTIDVERLQADKQADTL